MSGPYSKVTCPNCGQNIEYPAETELLVVPCPQCSEPVPISRPAPTAVTKIPAGPPAHPSAAPAGDQAKANLNAVAVLLTIAGLVMLIIGYSTPARIKAERAGQEEIENSIWQDEAREAIKAEKDVIKRIKEGRTNTPLEQRELRRQMRNADLTPKPMGEQEKLADSLTKCLEDNSRVTRGAIQCSTGWMLIAAGCIVFGLGRGERPGG